MSHYKPYDKDYRAQRRVQGEDVFGNKINVLPSATRSYGGNRRKNVEHSFQSYNMPAPPPGFYQEEQNSYFNQNASKRTQENQQIQQMIDACAFRPIRVSPMDVNNERHFWGRNESRRNCTPSEQLLHALENAPSRMYKNSTGSDYTTDEQKMGYSSENDVKTAQSNQPVDLVISNLDSNMEPKELNRLLTNMLKEYVMLLHLKITVQNDGTPVANIRVNSQREAQFAISVLHKQKLGHKKISISYAQSESPYPEELRAMIIELLQEAPDRSMPLFQFINLLESRYNCTISVSEVNKLKDVCEIVDHFGSRIVSLNQEVKTSTPPNLSRNLVQYCTMHCPTGIESRGWCELNTIQSPNVKMSLKLFGHRLFLLLKVHMGSMHLLSFQACYEQEFHEPLPVYDDGVPLEHFVTCVKNVEIKLAGPNKNMKIITYVENQREENEEEAALKCFPPSLVPKITLLCRELTDLLKTQDRCQLLISKFIPAYHHHFGRQCRLADYGYKKLLDLFEAISHVIQILNQGYKRTITLAHSAQMRRFTSDLIRVLKSLPTKQIALSDFPAAYEKVALKPFNAVEYGLCNLEDLLDAIPENIVVVSPNESGEIIIAVPKREQTPEEIMRTKRFAEEVINLLQHSQYFTILFNKFTPAYHHHFGDQCKVANYGFTRLIELFEAISDVVKIETLPDGDRTVSLTVPQALRVLGSQLVQIIKASPRSSLLINDLPQIYLREYGFPLEPQMYQCDTIMEVIGKLTDYVQVNNSNFGLLLVAIDVDTIPSILAVRCWGLLLKPPHRVDLSIFLYEYQSRYNSRVTMDALQLITKVITVSTIDDLTYIGLTELYTLAAQLYHVIFNNGGTTFYMHLEKLYQEYYSKPLQLNSYKIYSIDEFYDNFNLMFFIRSTKKKGVVALNRNLAEHFIPLPASMYKSKDLGGKRESPAWPPLPPLEMLPAVPNTKNRYCPPKPDTPPTPSSTLVNHWTSPPTPDSPLNLCIPMPIILNPKLLGNPYSLISPAKHMLTSPGRFCWDASMPLISSPHPTEVPMPTKLIQKGAADDSADSGVNIKFNNSQSDSENDTVSATQSTCKNDKRNCAARLNFNK